MSALLALPSEILQLILIHGLFDAGLNGATVHHYGAIEFCKIVDRTHPCMRANMRSAFSAWCSEIGLHHCDCYDVLENQALYEKFIGEMFWSKSTHLCFDCQRRRLNKLSI